MPRKTGGNIKDLLFERTTGAFAFLVLFLAVLLFAVLLRESLPALRKFGASFLVTGTWDPVLETFGAAPFIYGTVVSSFLAVLIAVPLSVGAAIFINEFAPPLDEDARVVPRRAPRGDPQRDLRPLGDLRPRAGPARRVHETRDEVPGLDSCFKGPVYGPSMLAAGVLLSIMIIPFILSVSREVLATVPQRQKEAVLSLGGTRWEMIRIVIGQHCIPGIFGATILGLGRALGETMAVTMVIGNRPEAILSLFQPGYSMAAVIANEFTEAVGDVYLSSLILIGLILLAMTFAVNLAAKWILTKMVARASRGI